MNARKILKQLWCMLFHQRKWRTHITSIDPYIKLDVCGKCGETFVKKRGFMTAEEVNRALDKSLKVDV